MFHVEVKLREYFNVKIICWTKLWYELIKRNFLYFIRHFHLPLSLLATKSHCLFQKLLLLDPPPPILVSVSLMGVFLSISCENPFFFSVHLPLTFCPYHPTVLFINYFYKIIIIKFSRSFSSVILSRSELTVSVAVSFPKEDKLLHDILCWCYDPFDHLLGNS
jgi:hypothetical protein